MTGGAGGARAQRRLMRAATTSKRLGVWHLAARVVLYYAAGIAFYYYYLDWGILQTAYFITVSVTTIGYGDFAPTDITSKIVTVFYLLAGLVLVGRALAGSDACSLTVLTRQIISPSRNGQAPSSIESRKSCQSVIPYYVWR